MDLSTAIPDAPPSTKAVFDALVARSPQTGKELRDATNLPRRTVYQALLRLKEAGLLQERRSLRDTRQTFFWLSTYAATTRNGEQVVQATA